MFFKKIFLGILFLFFLEKLSNLFLLEKLLDLSSILLHLSVRVNLRSRKRILVLYRDKVFLDNLDVFGLTNCVLALKNQCFQKTTQKSAKALERLLHILLLEQHIKIASLQIIHGSDASCFLLINLIHDFHQFQTEYQIN